MRLRARTVVVVTLEIDSVSHWGPDTTVKQVHDQGVDDALTAIRSLLHDKAGIRVVGKPEIRMVTSEEVE